MTIRDDIAKGPRFELAGDGYRDPLKIPCVACSCDGGTDRSTGLCRACWRAWRFGMAMMAAPYLPAGTGVERFTCAGCGGPHRREECPVEKLPQIGPWSGKLIETQMTPEQMARSRCPSCGAFPAGTLEERLRHELGHGADGVYCPDAWHKAKP